MKAFNSTYFLPYHLLCAYENICIVYTQYKFNIYLLLSLYQAMQTQKTFSIAYKWQC